MGALPRIFVWAALAAAAVGCADRGAEHAIGALESFQDALFARDTAAIHRGLTRGSRELVPHLPLDRLAGQQRLECLRAESVHGRWNVTVRDPNQDGREAIWVVVKEDGHWRVDLIETTRFNHREVALPGPARRFVPAELTPAQIREARAVEASAPR